jgi:hypothetical protein
MAGAVAGGAWGLAGAGLAFSLGRLGALDLVLRPLLVTGLGFGISAGVAFALLVSLLRVVRHTAADDAS